MIRKPRERELEMANANALKAENEALKQRLSTFSEASLRISESLDVNTVLEEVVASACALTGAGYGGISTMDESGGFQEFVTHGLDDGEHRQLVDLPGGEELWGFLKAVSRPIRLENLSAHLAGLGLPGHPLMERSFLGMPVRHRGAQVGLFYLLDKTGEEAFTEEDEETLAPFTAQAGAAIANARTYRDERRARADLEALVNTSPVAVVVFDARSGLVVSQNQETRRIAGDVCNPGTSVMEVLDALTVRRADGREIEPEEYPALVRVLHESVTVRAEEILLETPDGRKVTTLVNATPIVSEEDEVASVVVTLQDMTPIEEQERQRGEFLSMVSHELTAPLVSIKGCSSTAMESASGLSAAESQQFFRIIDAQAEHMRRLIADLMDSAQIETGSLSLATEPAELVALVDTARTMFFGGGRQNPVRIDLPPDLPRVRADRHRIVQVLLNLLTNAARHSPDSAAIRVEARLQGVHVEVSVVDEGPGIPTEQLTHLFRKYVRTGGEDRGIGAGLGLAICKGLVEAHGGRIWAESAGEGEDGGGGEGEDGGAGRGEGTSERKSKGERAGKGKSGDERAGKGEGTGESRGLGGSTGLGTRFTFTIPVVEEARTAAGASAGAGAGRVAERAAGRYSSRMPAQPGRLDEIRKPLILAVDDDPQALGYIRETIEKGGYRATVTGEPEKVKELVEAHQPDLLLLDLLLPGTDGIELMTSLPKRSDRPVIFLSAYGRDETIARALQLGAADYIVKPFSPTELIARIEAALRTHAGTPEPFRSGDLAINYEERRVELAGAPVRLTATEFDLLRELSTHAGRVVTYDQLLSSAWQMRNSGDARVVRVFVKKLRQKLGDDARNPTYIFTEPRVGYRMARASEPV